MAKAAKALTITKVREMDPEWHIKFKSVKELEDQKKYPKVPSHKLNLPKSKMNRCV